MAERIGIDINMTGMAEAVSGMEAVSSSTAAAATAMGAAARAGGGVAKAAQTTAEAERSFYQEAKGRMRQSRGAMRMVRGGAMLGLMGVEAGLNLMQSAFGEGPGGGVVKAASGIIGGATSGAMTGYMMGGAGGAVVGGAIGLVSSTISAIFQSTEGHAKSASEVLKASGAAIAQMVASVQNAAPTMAMMGNSFSLMGVSAGQIAARSTDAAKANNATTDAVLSLTNALADRMAPAMLVMRSTSEQGARELLNVQRALGLSADDTAALAVAADRMGVPIGALQDQMLQFARQEVAAGRAQTLSGALAPMIGGMGGVNNYVAMAGMEITRGGYGQVASALRTDTTLTPEERKARGEFGITAGMSAEQQIAQIVSGVGAGQTLKGTGLEKFEDVFKALADAGPAWKQTADLLAGSGARAAAEAQAQAARDTVAALQTLKQILDDAITGAAAHAATVAAEEDRVLTQGHLTNGGLGHWH